MRISTIELLAAAASGDLRALPFDRDFGNLKSVAGCFEQAGWTPRGKEGLDSPTEPVRFRLWSVRYAVPHGYLAQQGERRR